MQTAMRDFPQSLTPVYPLYTMKGDGGLTVSVLALGGVLQKIAISDKNGQERPLALGFPYPEPYESLVCYAGATLAPNAGRIRGGRLCLPGAEYALVPNDGPNQLHGGAHSLSPAVWEMERFTCGGDTASLVLRAAQPDGLDGWPGNRAYQVRYTLSDDNRLTIEYEARTDRPTYFNLSNHTYWNLSGDFTRPALGQELTVEADRVCVNDETHLPTALVPVEASAFAFHRGRSLRDALNSARSPSERRQLAIARGLNHAYLLNGGPGLKRACVLRDPDSGRQLELFTDAPGVVVYSGGFLPAGLELCGGQRSVPSCAVALEAQDLPDCSRLSPGAFRPTLPGEVWRRVIQYRFRLPR